MNRPFTKPVASPSSGPRAASPGSFRGEGPDSPDDGYGTRPRCTVCGRGFYGCICNVPDIDDMPAEEVNRISREWREIREARERYEAGEEDHGWILAERSALGMPGAGK